MRQASSTNNLLLVAIFALCVLFLIGASLIFKFVGIVRDSSFDGEHRFTVFLSDSAGNSAYLSVDPAQNTSTKLSIKNRVHKDEVIASLPVAVDGVVVVSGEIDQSAPLTELLQAMLIKRNNVRKNVTGIDLLRMYLFAKKTPPESREEEELFYSAATLNDISYADYFFDRAFSDEDKTIAIENASLKSGVGSRLEELLLVLGGNVISVETASVASSSSSIVYYDNPSYTTKKLGKLLGYKLDPTDRLGIADISIIIGEDGFNNLVFRK